MRSQGESWTYRNSGMSVISVTIASCEIVVIQKTTGSGRASVVGV